MPSPEILRNEADLIVVAHPDDAETMLGYAITQSCSPVVLIATDGSASTVDRLGGGFVSAGERLKESRHGLGQLGVPNNRQLHLGLPDGQLESNVHAVKHKILECMSSFPIGKVITLGSEGYDGHADHIAAHNAAIASVDELDLDHRPSIMGLNSRHEGRYKLKGNPAQKLAAMACHASQFDLDNHEFWNTFFPYVPLILAGETYDEFH